MTNYSNNTARIDFDILERVRELTPESNPLYSAMDDSASGRLFADIFKDVARYNATAKCWYIYNGMIWKEDTGEMEVAGLAKKLYKALYFYAGEISGPDANRFITYCVKLGSRRNRDIMLKDAQDLNYITEEMLDADLGLFNCQNCVIDLRTFQTIPHDPSLLLSKVSNVVYREGAASSEFSAFMRSIMCDDESLIDYLQTLFGYALTGETEREEMYILYGASTRNGKSTLVETISFMMGGTSGYSMTMTPETLAQKKNDSRQASGDIARLKGCRFLNASEPPKRMVFNVELLKILLGRDKITARHLYQREFEFVPVFKLVINTNYLPLINDDTVFSSGRIKVIPFEKHFSESEQDKKLKDRLKSEENISGIFNWCLEGLKRYRENNLVPPEKVTTATEEYRQKSDKIGTFFNECMTRANANTSAKSVYDEYSHWCASNGYGIENKGNFLAELRSKGLLADTGTVNGITLHNVIIGYVID